MRVPAIAASVMLALPLGLAANPPVVQSFASAEASTADSIQSIEMLVEDMADSQERLEEASAHLRRNLERAREHLHDADPIDGALPPMAGMDIDALVEMLCETGDQPAARWNSGG